MSSAYDANAKPAVNFPLEWITPAIAQHYLKKVPLYQRGVDDATVQMYAEDMQNGKWDLTHQGLAFDTADQLLDGQHKCHAVVKAQASLWLPVFRGLEPEAYRSCDRGRIRELSFVTGLPTQKVAILRWATAVEAGTFAYVKLSPARLIAQHGKYREASDTLFMHLHQTTFTAPIAGALAAAWALDPERIVELAVAIAKGAGLPDGHPALAVRTFLMSKKNTPQADRARLGVMAVVALFDGGAKRTLYRPSDADGALKKLGKWLSA